MHLSCDISPSTGTIQVNGTVNACPRIDSLDASPAEVSVGGSLALFSSAVNTDHSPMPLVYSWTTSSGTLPIPRQPPLRSLAPRSALPPSRSRPLTATALAHRTVR